jgi:hypothetical protein
MEEILRNADHENKERLADFCSKLKVGGELGSFGIDMVHTARRWRVRGIGWHKKPIFKTTNVPVAVIDEAFVSNCRKMVNGWDDASPNHILSKVREVEQSIERSSLDFLASLQKNLARSLSEIEWIDSRLWNGWQSPDSTLKELLFDFALGSELRQRIKSLTPLMDRFNDQLKRYRELHPSDQEKQKEALVEILTTIQKEREYLTQELDKVRATLYRCRV